MPYPLPEPQAREDRPAWERVPAAITQQLESLLKDRIVQAETGWGGFSPAAVFIATLSSGKKVFVKGAHPGDDAHGTQMLRQEVEAYKTVPVVREVSPEFLGVVGGCGEDSWLLAVFEHIALRAPTPWTERDVANIFERLRVIHTCRDLPLAVPAAAQKNYVEKFLRPEGGWLKISRDRNLQKKVADLFVEGGDEWLAKNLSKLCAWQEKAARIGGPAGLLHQDLRADNFLLKNGGGTYLVDWPNYCTGPVALDIAAFLPMITLESALPLERLLTLYEQTTGISLDAKDLAIALAALSGHAIDNAYRSVPPKLPRLRWLQKITCDSMLKWAVSLCGIDPAPPFKS